MNRTYMNRTRFFVSLILITVAITAAAQERPYFVTYSHEMEEPGNLEIESFNVLGHPPGGNLFFGSTLEFEYGVRAWWTSEFYLDGQSTQNDSTIFTGFRWENRIRPLLREHIINPVLYIEYENTSADKSLREVVGHDGVPDLIVPNGEARPDVERELELKLILGTNWRGWNLSENFISEKEPCRRALGVRLCLGSQPASRSGGKCSTLQLLSRKVPGRC